MSRALLTLFAWLLCGGIAAAAIVVEDDSGAQVQLQQPAQRIVSLAPGLTELLFSIGAGARVVAVDQFSDYPPAARALPRVASAGGVDLEGVLAARPDLIVLWRSGSSARLLARLRALGVAVYVSRSRELADIATDMERLGRLTGREQAASAAAAAFRGRVAKLHQRYRRKHPVSVFYQVWDDPLITVNGSQFISDVIALCGGVNVFADLPESAPHVTVESVLARDPDVLVAGRQGQAAQPLAHWRAWPQLRAVQHQRLFYVPADLLQRPSARLLDGAQLLCRQMASVARSEVAPHR